MSSPEANNVYDGYICIYGVEYPDHYMIAPGALKSSDNIPIAYTPENSSPEFIGSAKLESDSCGMLAHCQFLDNYAGLVDLLKSGEYDLGFTAFKVKYTTDDKGVKHYTQGTIRNVGILPYPYNPRVKPVAESNEVSGEDCPLKNAINHARKVAEEMRKQAAIGLDSMEDTIRVEKCKECASEYEQIASWLEELAERRESDRWIPVSERLPEYRHAVLVYCPENENVYCAFHDDKHWCVFGSYETVWQRVTHWKPLPKPYESEAEV